VEAWEERSITRKITTEAKKTADWKVAYIIGLSGTILVTGVAGPMVGAIGTWGWILMVITVIVGAIYCFFLAELATMFPEKVGGLPTYAVEGFRDKPWCDLLGGLNNWAYWMGWSPVITVNTSIMAVYAAVLGGYYDQFYAGVLPKWPIGYLYLLGFTVLVTAFLYAINYFGLTLGYRSALGFAVLSIVPLFFLGIAPIVTGAVNWSNISPANTGQVTVPFGTFAWFLAVWPWFFITTWNALAMEATAGFLGEVKKPVSDAPRAMTAAALTGLVIYTIVPFALLGVLGATSVAADPWGGFIKVAEAYAGPYSVYFVGIMLFAALLLSTTNALIGCSRSLYQSAIEGQTIRWFGKLNKHGSPARAMLWGAIFNCALVLVVAGLPTLVYVVSNCGYLFSFIPTGLAYYRLKKGYKGMPERLRPFSLPKIMGPIALFLVSFFIAVFIIGGPLSAYSVYAIAGLPIEPIFFFVLGIVILLMGIPMYVAAKKGS
jgi:amino acid transporter